MPDRDRDALRALRAATERAGLTEAALKQLVEIGMPDDVGLLNHAAAVERLSEREENAAILARLFYLETEESAANLRRVFAGGEIAALVSGGLLARTRRGGRARLRLDLVADSLVLADRRFERPDARAFGLPRGDMVYPPGGDSALLAGVVATLDGAQVLDLCSGSGLQGIVAARRARQVQLVDVSARAAAVGRANARLNGSENVSVLIGDLYRPIGHARFDLIIANPPFVPGPGRGPAYHSGGPRGDRVLRRVLAGLVAHLRPGGRAVAISHLALGAGEVPAARLAPVLRSFPGRVLLLALETGSPVDLAAAQAVFALRRGLGAYARELRGWVAYLRRRRVERIAALIVVAERRGRRRIDVIDGSPRVLPLPLSKPPIDHVREWLNQ